MICYTFLARQAPVIFLMLACAVTLSACGNDSLDFRNAEIVNARLYSQGANSPFSGKLTNIPITRLTAAQSGFSRVISVIGFAAPFATINGIGLGSICDVPVSDGLPDGKAVCKAPGSNVVRMELDFSDGVLDGPFRLNDETGENVFSEVSFRAGHPDGTQKVYDPKNGKLALSLPWSHGVMTGIEEAYSTATGNRVLEIHRDDQGKLDGEYAEWSQDGTLVHKLTYVDGRKNGVEERFYPETGKLASHLEWDNDRQDGLTQTYNSDGTPASTLHFENGKQVFSEEEVQALAQKAAAETYGHCMKSAMLGELSSTVPHAAYEDKARSDCTIQAQATMQAKQQSPDSNGLAVIMSKASNAITPALPAAPATHIAPAGDGPATKRCGWIENTLPGGELALTDRDGSWSIVSASGQAEGFPDRMPATDHGTSCGCLNVETNKKAMRITKVLGGQLTPATTCERDPSLQHTG